MPRKKILTLLAIGLLAITVPLFILLAQTQQDIRQNASEIVSCDSVKPDEIAAKPQQIRKTINATYSAQIKSLLTTYRNSDTNSRLEIRKQLHQLLTDRKTALIATMRTNPKTALQQIKSIPSSADTASISSNCLEKPTRLSGTVHVEHADFTDKTTKEIFTLTTPENQTVTLHNPDNYPHQLYSGAELTASGYLVDQDFLVNNDQPIILASTTPPLLQAAASTSRKVAILLVNFSDTPKPSLTQNQVLSTFSEVTAFHKENSYGRVNLSPSVYGWYQLNLAKTCSNTPTISNEAMNAANDQVDFTAFDHIMIVAPFLNCGWAGLGDVGSYTRTTPDGKKLISFSFIDSDPFLSPVTMEHELGHNLGSYHAAFGDNTYGDIYDIMGGFTGEMNAAHKDAIGVFSSGELKTVTTNGTYSIIPIETQTSGVKGLRIDAGASGIFYIEYRQPLGADSVYSQQNFPGTDVFQGALIHRYLPRATNTIDTYLIDPSSPQSAETAALKLNTTYTIPNTTAKIKTTDVTSQSITVAISGLESIVPNPTATPIPSPTRQPISISGTLYLDNNSNKTMDTGDYVYTPSTSIELRKDDGSQSYPMVTGSTTTANGSYRFDNLASGDYKITAVIPSTFTPVTGNPIYVHLTTTKVTINFGLIETPTVPTATPTVKPTITLAPTRAPSLTPTRTPSPTISQILTPTQTPTPDDSHIQVSLFLHGIGKAGDSTNPGSNGNLSPQTPRLQAQYTFTNLTTNEVFYLSFPIEYNNSKGNFIADFFTSKLSPGKYRITASLPKYLTATYSQIAAISKGQLTKLPDLSLIIGDVTSDNRINILDYDILVGCIQNISCSQEKKSFSDLNDSGTTDADDLNLFLREINVLRGDSI